MTAAALLLAWSAAAFASAEGAEPVGRLLSKGDALWMRRASGAKGSQASAATTDAALAAYREALRLAPGSIEARWRLMRALFYRGSFCGASGKQRLAIFDEARRTGEDGVRPVERAVAGRKGEARLAALREVPEGAALYFWTAISWGQWALYTGKLSAARRGAAGKIRDYAETAIALEPGQEQGGAYVLLGRLHDQSPKIPFLTPWISRAKAIASLRRALEFGPDNTVALYFLAEALLHHAPERRDEAKALLERCASLPPRPEYLVEDRHYVELSQERLAMLRAPHGVPGRP
jgi:tetratricopeptide (TPR) repeat protein